MRGSLLHGRGFLLLRSVWMFWLASFVVLFAVPTLVLEAISQMATASRYNLWEGIPHAGDPWSWDVELCLPMVLALVVPSLSHRVLVRRVVSPFFLQQRRADVEDYRSPQPWAVTTSPRLVRRLVGLYAGRLGLAMAISMVPFSVLMSTRFVNSTGCVQPAYVRSVPEQFAFAAILLVVALVHMPTTARVIGERPSVETCRGRRAGGE